MFFKVFFFVVLLLSFLTPVTFKFAYALNRSNQRTYQESPVVIHKLDAYKQEFHFLSLEIVKKKKNIDDLKSKIKLIKSNIKILKDEIDMDSLVSRSLIRRIFIIQRDKDTLKLASIRGSIDYFIAFYQLKTILYRERFKLNKLVARRDRFLKMKIYFKKERADLKKAVESMRISRYKLNKLIKNIQAYMRAVRIKYMKMMRDKKNRLLKKKVIKLMHKINDKSEFRSKSKHRDIKFIILR